MATRRSRSRRFGFEGLEPRELLSGSAPGVHAASLPKSGMMPDQELTLKGHFSPGVPTSVTFAGKGVTPVTVTASAASKSAVVVAVPAFFDSQTGQPVAAKVSVSVRQGSGGAGKSVTVLKSLSVAALPMTGLMAGDVLGAVSNAAASVTADATSRFAQIEQDPFFSPSLRQAAAGVVADLEEVQLAIPVAQEALISLAFGATSTVPLGSYLGQAATLDAGQLGLLDRVLAAGIDDAAGKVETGPALVASLDGLIAGTLRGGPSAVIARARQVVDVLSTATGSPVVPPGAVAAGLVLGSLSAVVASAEAEALLILSSPSPTGHLGTPDVFAVDQVLDDPALGQSLAAIGTNLDPLGTLAGTALVQANQLAEDLAARIDPNVPGSVGALFAG